MLGTIRYSLFYLDPDVKEINTLDTNSVYTMSSRAYRLSHANYTEADDAMSFFEVPNGDHVLTIITDPSNPTQVTSLTHIIVF